MKSINVYKMLEANKENRNFHNVQNRQTRVLSTINFKDEFNLPKPKPNIIRVSKWNKSSNLRPRPYEEPPRQISYDATRQKVEVYIHPQRTLKNRSLTNIQVPVPNVQVVPHSVPSSLQNKKQLQSLHTEAQNVIPYNDEIL